MTAETLRNQCQQAFSLLKDIHRRATIALMRTTDETAFDFTKFGWDDNPRPMIAIDGSYRKLWHDLQTDSSIYLFRVAATSYVYEAPQALKLLDVKLIDHVTLLTRDNGALKQQDGLNLEAKLNMALLNFAAGDARHTSGGAREMALLASGFQEFYEHQLALNLAHETKGHLLAIDGSLATLKVQPLQAQLNRLAGIARRHDHWLVGITKVNRTKTMNHLFTDEEVIARSAPNESMAFVPWKPPQINWIARIGLALFARFHPKALKWFRVDLFPDNLSPATVFPALAQFSKDLRLPGYPVPLLEAHRICKMIRNVEIIPESVILESGLDAALTPEELLAGLTDSYERVAGGFHEQLDRS
ncbi:MAG: hypothetical protein ACXACI_19760 [Candidatus Hodarchaeales archaeon]|jgi:hypothetical protein